MDELEAGDLAFEVRRDQFHAKGRRRRRGIRDRLHASLDKVFAQIDGDGLRTMRWLYTDGDHIEFTVVRTPVEGIPLPSIEEAAIHRPIFYLDAHATISDYKLTLNPPGTH